MEKIDVKIARDLLTVVLGDGTECHKIGWANLDILEDAGLIWQKSCTSPWCGVTEKGLEKIKSVARELEFQKKETENEQSARKTE